MCRKLPLFPVSQGCGAKKGHGAPRGFSAPGRPFGACSAKEGRGREVFPEGKGCCRAHFCRVPQPGAPPVARREFLQAFRRGKSPFSGHEKGEPALP